MSKPTLKVEEEAINIYETQLFLFRKSVRSRRIHLPDTPQVLSKLKELWGKTGSGKIYEKFSNLTITYHIYNKTFGEILTFCSDVEDLITTGKLDGSGINYARFYHFKAYACLKTKKYEQGLLYLDKISEHMEEAACYDPACMETFFILAMRSEKKEIAKTIAQMAVSKNVRQKESTDIPRWKILLGYLYLIHDPEHLGKVIDLKRLKRLIPHSDTELLIIFYVLEISYLFHFGKMADIPLAYETVNIAMKKYKTDDMEELRRLEWFRGFLQIVVNNEFNLSRINPRGINILAKLNSQHDTYSRTEILPFDELGHSFLQLMRRGFPALI